MSTAVIERIKKEIASLEVGNEAKEIGTVISVADGIAEIEGLQSAQMMEMVAFDTAGGQSLKDAIESGESPLGLILNLEEETVKVVILGGGDSVKEGMTVKRTGKLLSIPVGEDIVGRVVNPLGEPLDDRGAIKADEDMPIERVAFGVMERSSVNEPIHTGIKAIDSMIPIGRGQRELIIGDRGTGKTTIAIDTIINQKYEPKEKRPICIYVAIGQKQSKTANIVRTLEEAGAMEYTVVVSTSASEASPILFLAPFAGVAIAEYFMLKGRDVVVVFDDLSKHAVAYRQMSLLLRRPPGREAYPGDIFYLHSRLLERSAKLSKELGGGSITALPIIETQEGDVSAYIPTNVISITDGQIFLEMDLFNKGVRPALNVGISVSRVGSSAQTKAMKKVAGKIRLELAQFRELEAFMQFAADLDDDTKKRIENGRKFTELLKQRRNQPIAFHKQVLMLYAANNGIMDGAPVENVSAIEEKYVAFVERDRKNLLDTIEKEQSFTDEDAAKMDVAIADFKDTHSDLYTSK
ncbi:F0F1 ATP synthase subunit alpha [Candidatus Parcubacteria bacterium]|uniref:ATP synthase subunit alpha n=1 Tax=Candidatus Kaiserbacteria bacterium CG10_big_fil_rev_8_21_14_0_10_47_16 TaxID=1974608 RepID=A0A2H0UDH8_9BACT|nr:F0F1 ATP synthase subunit alpha [Candidatus Parcubacteria bacterium]PIR84452.1 MAG: F0F1 ATP synthase subunit alpha [Candidatus Kaiserbacteria bacterium CG10_big_fil_rev_8_21_14_0_10_47_16]